MGRVADMLTEFHRHYRIPVRKFPNLGWKNERMLRRQLILEEAVEAGDALIDDDLVATAHELADVVYVAYGTAVQFGIDLDAVLEEVHRANMSKLGADGKPIYRDDGKVLKGPHYSPPDIASVLRR